MLQRFKQSLARFMYGRYGPDELNTALLLPMLLLGLITGFAAFLLYTCGLRRLEAGRASVIASFELVFGALVGLIAFGERIGADAAAGIVLILAAVGVLSIVTKK